MSLLKKLDINKLFVLPLTESQQKTAITYGLWMYGLIVGMSTVYGIKKGVQQWLEWKLTRHYRSLHNQNIDSIIDIACDGGTLAFYAMTNGLFSAFIASTAFVSVPILHFFRLDKNTSLNRIDSDSSIDSIDSNDTNNINNNNNFNTDEIVEA